jgi:hypothetical protein
VWIPDADKVWKAAHLLENYHPKANILKIQTDEDEIVIHSEIYFQSKT